MNKTTKTILSLAACVALVGGAAFCGRPNAVPTDSNEQVLLRTYEVPMEHRDALRNMLRSVLGSEENRIGRVSNGPGGTLLVVAPAQIQAGIQGILAKGFEVPPVPGPVKLTYWLLVGRPLASPSEGPFKMAGGPVPTRLDPTLARIASAQGPSEFSLLETFELTSMSQERAHASGAFARITQRASRSGSQVVADLEIVLDNNVFKSRVMLESEQVLVLGQSGFAGKRGEAFADVRNEDSLTLYYVLTAELEQ
ncbi:MAG: hypothetical protein GY716_00620 [bacterium]|nr:hypothetical protein [bacterium]